MALEKFVLFRHAHKESWSDDPELSEKGHRQAILIAEKVHRNGLPHPGRLLSSPKKRAQQTFVPLEEEFQIPLIIEPQLDERNHHETGKEFETRIKNFLQFQLPHYSEACVYLCTHLDWLEVFSLIAPLKNDIASEILHLPPAHYYYFSITPGDRPWELIKRGGIK
jgi:broad specificity phosphatase PhoE